MIRRWEIVDTHQGDVFSHVSKHFTRRTAGWWCRFYGMLVRYRPGYELRVQRRGSR